MLGEAFTASLDAALASWAEEHWGCHPRGMTGARLADAWSMLAKLATHLDEAEETARVLRQRFPEAAEYLEPLSTGPSRDPYGRYLGALAAHQTDRSLASFWWRLCDLPQGLPIYRARWALEGLRGLPAPEDELEDGFRPEAVRGLARLANALRVRLRQGELGEKQAKTEFLTLGHLNLAALPFPERWRQILAREVPQQSDGGKWLRLLVPNLRKAARDTGMLSWSDRAKEIAHALERGSNTALHNAERLLQDQRAYASSHGDSEFLVQSLCNFAKSVWERRSGQAIEWAEEALRWEPYDPYTWGTLTKALVFAERWSDALGVGWQALGRFPEDAVVHTTLADTLHRARFLDEAEALYRESAERFPDNAVPWAGLAEVLRSAERLDEALKVYEHAARSFPTDDYARDGLQRIKRHFQEHRAQYLTAAEIAEPSVPYGEPERQAGATGRFSRTAEARLLRRAARRAEQEARRSAAERHRRRALCLLEALLTEQPQEPGALTEKAILLLESGQIPDARGLLEDHLLQLAAAPGLLCALARTEREQAAAQHRRLESAAVEELLSATHRLRSLSSVFEPLVALQEGRAYLALTDGDLRRQRAGSAFDRLHRWVEANAPAKEGFIGWWARQMREHALHPVAGREKVREEDVDGLEIWQRDHARQLDTFEEDFSNRHIALRLEPKLPGELRAERGSA
jgi:tetratricopeptide (TPR) repeat protein